MINSSDKTKTSTRDVILNAIKQSTDATVDTLAVAAGISPVTVRHHLNSLMADGLLETTPIRRKVGRPYLVYTLTQNGHELFPQKYVRLSTRLIEELKDKFPPEIVNELFEGVVRRLVEEHRPQFEPLDFPGRLDYVVMLLEQEGFLARWEQDGDSYKLIEHSCPYISVGQTHSEICTFDRVLISTILETEISHESCMLDGDSCCQFTIEPNSIPVI